MHYYEKIDNQLYESASNDDNAPDSDDHVTSSSDDDIWYNDREEQSSSESDVEGSLDVETSDTGDLRDRKSIYDLDAQTKIYHDSIEIISLKPVGFESDVQIRWKLWCEEMNGCNKTEFKKINNIYLASNLQMDTEYRIHATAGLECARFSSFSIKTLICGPPYDFQIKRFEGGNYYASWEKPIELGYNVEITMYIIDVYDKSDDKIKTFTINPHVYYKKIALNSSVDYKFGICCKSSHDLYGEEAYAKVSELKYAVLKNCKSSNGVFYTIKTNRKLNGHVIPFNEFQEPKFLSPGKSEKVLLILGGTGVGKSTWINGFINSVFKMKKNDHFRLKLVDEDEDFDQTQSKTKHVTMYRLLHHEGFMMDYNITIIDTPGFCDTRGVDWDFKIADEIHSLFSLKNGYLNHITAVAFVIPEAEVRLTASQKYLFGSILSLFGKNIQENLILLTTYARRKSPKTIKTLRAFGVEIDESRCFNFENNVIMSVTNERSERDIRMANTAWDEMMKNYFDFSNVLNELQPQNISQTHKVLEEKVKVRLHLSSKRQAIDDGMIALEQLKTKSDVLQQINGDQGLYKDDPIKRKLIKYDVLMDIEGNVHTICNNCKRMCHENCIIDDDELATCIAMDSNKVNSVCKMCPNKCPWYMHDRLHVKIVRIEICEDKNFENVIGEIKDEYRFTALTKDQFPVLEKYICEDTESMICRIKADMSEIIHSQKNLKAIAIIDNPESQTDYINQLIATENTEQQNGYKFRLKLLRQFLDDAKELQSIGCGDCDPFGKYREAIDKLIHEGYDIQKPDELRKVLEKVKSHLPPKQQEQWWEAVHIFFTFSSLLETHLIANNQNFNEYNVLSCVFLWRFPYKGFQNYFTPEAKQQLGIFSIMKLEKYSAKIVTQRPPVRTTVLIDNRLAFSQISAVGISDQSYYSTCVDSKPWKCG